MVRYGSEDTDYDGQICLVKLISLQVATQIRQAEMSNCAGVLLYSDEVIFGINEDDKSTAFTSGAANYGQGDPSRPTKNRNEMQLPRIPILPITLDKATILNERCVLGSTECNATVSVTMEESTSATQDIIGYIYGDISPDKYIMIGAAHDSIGPGATKTGLGLAFNLSCVFLIISTKI